MKAKLVRIGNSRGVRIPKPLIEEAGIEEDVEIQVDGGHIVISRLSGARRGWEEAAMKIHSLDEDVMLADSVPTSFDDEEWQWS